MRQDSLECDGANGDWFVIEVDGQRCVLVFRNLMEAWRARAKNDELMLFWPTPLDECRLVQFAIADEGRPLSFFG
jgi:hypothetical protein